MLMHITIIHVYFILANTLTQAFAFDILLILLYFAAYIVSDFYRSQIIEAGVFKDLDISFTTGCQRRHETFILNI